MKNTFKKVLAMLLVVCMALPMFVVAASAETVTGTGTNYTWSYDTEKKVLTYTASGAERVMIDVASGTLASYKEQVEEIVIQNNGKQQVVSIASTAFQQWYALKKVTIPKSIDLFNNYQNFNADSALEEIVVEGEAYVPGAADLRFLKRAGSNQLDTEKHRTFEGTKFTTIILPGGFYSESKPIKAYPPAGHWAEKSCSFGNAVETIMGPSDDAYLRSFAAANGWKYVPYGTIGQGTAWSYDEAAKVVTIYGNGTSSTLTALSDDDVAILKDATKVVIRADITAIETGALAGLTNLKEVEFLGNAPETTGNPFGSIKGLGIYVPTGATGFGEVWNGYTVASLITGTEGGVDWTYNPATGVFTQISNGTNLSLSGLNESANPGNPYIKQIKEIVLKNGSTNFTGLHYGMAQLGTAVVKVTIPATVTYLNSTQQFNGATSLKEIVVEGNAYIPGAVDFTSITAASLNGSSHRVFENTAIEVLILRGGVYSDSKPIVKLKSDGKTSMLGASLKTIMGPHNDTYLKSFAADNGYSYVPYGKIGTGTAWTYDEATKTVTIYGNGTSSALTALSAADAEFLKDATKVVIRADITSIATDALAGLTSLEEVVFVGNAPATEGNPFGTIAGLTISISLGATGFGDEWNGYTVSYPTFSGEFIGSMNGTALDGAWKFTAKDGTLYVWGTQKDSYVYIPNLVASDDFKAFAAGEYGKTVKIVNFRNEDSSIIVHIIGSNNDGFNALANAGLINIEKIFVGGTTTKEVKLYRFMNMFKGLSKLTTFGREGTAEGTVNLDTAWFDGGASNGSFSGQTGVKKVILPAASIWGYAFDFAGTYSSWANIPANYFKGMTGLEEVVLNANTEFANTEGAGAYFRGTCMIGANAFDGCTSLTTLTIPAGARATTVFRKSTNVNEYTVNLFNADTFKGSSIKTLYVLTSDVANAAAYNIPNVAGMNIICANDAVKAEFVQDAPAATVSNILAGEGIAVRYEKYNGLRNIFSFNNTVYMGNYTLVEYGAMLVSSTRLGDSALEIDAATLEPTVAAAVKRAIWNKDAENPWTGKVLSHDEEGLTQFALTLTNFTSNWDSDVYGRAYAVYEDTNGNRFVVYADNGPAVSLYDAMVSGAQQGALNGLVCDDAAVESVLATGKVADVAVDGLNVMVINGKTEDAAKVLVVRRADGSVATADDIAAAKAAATGYTLDERVIALAFK